MATTLSTYYLPPTEHAPNNPLPVLHYKDALPQPRTERRSEKGTWGAIWISHFHPNNHECYGVFQGSPTLLLGAAGEDGTSDVGLRITVHTGDVIVPAGTGHRGCPKWRNEYGKTKIDSRTFLDGIAGIGTPEEDPVYERDGSMVGLWSQPPRANT
ncbi:hypothetical protein BDV12DRAFT_197026 [Aspergillus spectabilis]